MVEGQDDLYTIAELMGCHINWPKEAIPVQILSMGGYDKVVEPHAIPLRLKSREVEILGVIIDADDNADSRWNKLRHIALPFFPNMPKDLSAGGAIADSPSGKRLGVWIMPDNQSQGMLENFVQFLVPPDGCSLLTRAKEVVGEVHVAGAPCRDAHIDKAVVHTWLAWQDPPGERFGTAILQKILDGRSVHANPFVSWFRALYEV